MEVCGIPAPEVLAKGQRKTKFFNESNMPRLAPNSHGKIRKPGTKVLDDILECSDQSFVNFVEVSLLKSLEAVTDDTASTTINLNFAFPLILSSIFVEMPRMGPREADDA